MNEYQIQHESSPAQLEQHENKNHKHQSHFTRPEASRYTRISEEQIENAIKNGELAYYERNPRGDKGFLKADLDAWIISKRKILSQASNHRVILDDLLKRKTRVAHTQSKTAQLSVTSH